MAAFLLLFRVLFKSVFSKIDIFIFFDGFSAHNKASFVILQLSGIPEFQHILFYASKAEIDIIMSHRNRFTFDFFLSIIIHIGKRWKEKTEK